MSSRPWIAAGLLALALPGCAPAIGSRDRDSARASVAPTPSATTPAAAPTIQKSEESRVTSNPTPNPNPNPKSNPNLPARQSPGSDSLLKQAERLVRVADFEGAIRVVERLLAMDSKHRQGLFLYADLLHARGSELDTAQRLPLHLKAAEMMRRLRAAYKDLQVPERILSIPLFYDEACALALHNQPEKALDALADSVDAGLDRPEELAHDDELASIRHSARYAELLRKVEDRARKNADEIARSLLATTKPFPFRFSLTDLDGKTVKFDDLPGEVILVHLWGTWCPPCRKEVPHLQALYEKYSGEGLTVVGIAYERAAESDAQATVRDFVKTHQVRYPCLIGDNKTLAQIPDFIGYPTILLVDRGGTTRARVVGYEPLRELESLVRLVLRPETKTN